MLLGLIDPTFYLLVAPSFSKVKGPISYALMQYHVLPLGTVPINCPMILYSHKCDIFVLRCTLTGPN